MEELCVRCGCAVADGERAYVINGEVACQRCWDKHQPAAIVDSPKQRRIPKEPAKHSAGAFVTYVLVGFGVLAYIGGIAAALHAADERTPVAPPLIFVVSGLLTGTIFIAAGLIVHYLRLITIALEASP